MTIAATITAKGQVTIPKRVREALHASRGSKVLFDIQPAGVRLRTTPTLRNFQGLLANRRKPADWDEIRRETRQSVAREAVHVKP